MKTEKRPGNSISLALFDMDGLLFDTENLFLTQSEETQQEMGYDVPLEAHMEVIGRTSEDVRRLFLEHMGEDFPFSNFFERTNRRVIERIEQEGIPVKQGVFELIDSLRRRGVASALASSSSLSVIERNLKNADMEGMFSLVVGGNEVERGKPAPDIFLLAAERAGRDPEECIVFEDSNNGVRAAYAAGMRPVMVPDIEAPGAEVVEMAYRVYSSLSEAAEDLDALLHI
ncbi:MAG: HAD family phosphatase [Spirochaetia bacterium]